ncbi:MAG: efflux RND transporter periplasmic adaptor subunit [candidate division Zixibacteria bacterium]|nr:efflux RND transporter periplasmic adaptor subunit [candidate division Zixibacteria bacterium]
MTNQENKKVDLSNLRINRQSTVEPIRTGKYLKAALWIIIPIAVIGAAIWVGFALMAPAIEVKTAVATQITQNQAQAVLSATGYVVAARKAEVASKATGRLEYLGVEEGDAVKEGQIIARVENNDMQAALDYAKAILDQVRAESVQAAIAFARQKELVKSGAVTQAEFDISEAKYKGLIAGVKSAMASVKSAEVALENTFIRAPFDGTVLNKYADVGEIVAPMSSSASSKGAVVVLADMNSLEVEADVAESNIQRVILGQRCEIILDAYPGTRYSGFVKKIVPTADRSRATVMTKVGFTDKDSRVLPEMSARINFLESDSLKSANQSLGGVMVPSDAIAMRDNKPVVFTIINNRAQMLAVTIGRQLGKQIEIARGVAAGQQVIVSPPANLKTKDKVKVIQ